MKTRQFMAMAVVGIMIASGFFILASSSVNASMVHPQGSGTVNVSISSFKEVINSWPSYDGHYVASVMTKAPNGDYLAFARNGSTHVAPGDYAPMLLYRSTDQGSSWHLNCTLMAISHRDVRNYAAGTSPTGRVFVFFWVYDTDNDTDPKGPLEYTYSDNSGVTWTAPVNMTIPAIDGKPGAMISSPYGMMITLGSNRIAFSYYPFNGKAGQIQSESRLAYSDDNGATWNHSRISNHGLDPYLVDETAIVYVGGNQVIALCRNDSMSVENMFSSLDNGVTWTDRGMIYLTTIISPMLITKSDTARPSGLWVIGVFEMGTHYGYSYAYAPDLINYGANAWPTFVGAINETLHTPSWYASYPTSIFNPMTGNYLVLTDNNSHALSTHTISISIAFPGTGLLPANVHQYVTLILVMFGLVMVVTTVGFMTKAKDKGISKEEVTELAIFLIISFVMMGILIAILGPV